MAGICAAFGPGAEELVKEICESLRHRGPDGEGFFVARNLALGHRAHNIGNTPVSHQPLSNEDGTIWITFDGEIYNKTKLIEQLKENHNFKTNSSAEVVIHAYEEYGPNCVKQFNGMFAFCLWDSAKTELFCARDRMGITPLYYYDCSGLLLFASEIKALVSLGCVPKKPNEQIIYDYLMTAHQAYTDNTFFTGIKRLLPAHYLTVNQNRLNISKYWDPVKRVLPHQLSDEDEFYALKFRELLRNSVEIRITENHNFGTFLSGGLDSPAIACLANEILNSRSLNSSSYTPRQEFFSSIYRGPVTQGNEMAYINEVVRALKTETNYIFPSVSDSSWDDIKQFIYSIDEPISVFNYYVFWCLSREARKKVKTVFYGMTGGLLAVDTVNTYKSFFKELLSQKKIARLLIELVGATPRIRMSSISKLLNRDSKSETKRLLSPQFAANFLREEQTKDSSNADYRHFRGGLLDHLRVCDRVSYAFSIEPRYPFLDHRLIEFVFSLPLTQRIRNGWTKYVLRNAMKGVIPEAVRKSRKKFGTPIPLELWMRELRRHILKIFQSSKFRERGYFNQPAILNKYEDFCNGKMDNFSSAYYAELFWRILNLELWFETYFDLDSAPAQKLYNNEIEGSST